MAGTIDLKNRETLQECIRNNEFFGLNPDRGYFFGQTLKLRYGETGELLSLFLLLPAFPLTFLYYSARVMASPPKVPSISEGFREVYEKKAMQRSVERSWKDSPTYTLTQLREEGVDSLKSLLKKTAGHVQVEVIPKPHKLSSPQAIEFFAGGLIPRKVHLDSFFYGEDENGARGYFGLPHHLRDAWMQLIAASDHRETVLLGIQLDRDFDFSRKNYEVQHISLPKEKISFGDPVYRVVPLEEIKALAEKKKMRKVDKDRIFRAMCELGFVY